MALVTSWPDDGGKLWHNFSIAEMACRCGCGALPDAEFMAALQSLCTLCHFPFVVISGARSPAHDEKFGGKGPHTIARSTSL